MEPSIADLEGKIAPALTNLIEQMNPNAISSEERLQIAIFCAMLSSRVPYARETIKDMTKGIKEKLKDNASPQLLKQLNIDDNQIRALSMEIIKDSVEKISPIIYEMKWSIGKAKFGASIHTSDNPLLKYNPVDFSPYGNLGYLCRYIQITFPLTPYLFLFMYHHDDYPYIQESFYFDYNNALHIKSLLVYNATRFLYAKFKDDFDIREGMRWTRPTIVIS